MEIRLRDVAAIRGSELAAEPLRPPPPVRPAVEAPHPDADFVKALQKIHENRAKCVLWNPHDAETVKRSTTPKLGFDRPFHRDIIPHPRTAERKENKRRANEWMHENHKPVVDSASKIRSILGVDDEPSAHGIRVAVKRMIRTQRFQSRVLRRLDRDEIHFENWLREEELDRDAAHSAEADERSRQSMFGQELAIPFGMGLLRGRTRIQRSATSNYSELPQQDTARPRARFAVDEGLAKPA